VKRLSYINGDSRVMENPG